MNQITHTFDFPPSYMTTCAYEEMASAKVYSIVGSCGAYFFLSVVASICRQVVAGIDYLRVFW